MSVVCMSHFFNASLVWRNLCVWNISISRSMLVYLESLFLIWLAKWLHFFPYRPMPACQRWFKPAYWSTSCLRSNRHSRMPVRWSLCSGWSIASRPWSQGWTEPLSRSCLFTWRPETAQPSVLRMSLFTYDDGHGDDATAVILVHSPACPSHA